MGRVTAIEWSAIHHVLHTWKKDACQAISKRPNLERSGVPRLNLLTWTPP